LYGYLSRFSVLCVAIRKSEKRRQIRDQEGAVVAPVSVKAVSSPVVSGGKNSGVNLSQLEYDFEGETLVALDRLHIPRSECENLINYLIDRLWDICETHFPLPVVVSSDAGLKSDAEIVRELVIWVDGSFSTFQSGCCL
jgi:hypothetical protein